MGSIAAMQAACDRIAALNIGYDQSNRWSFFTRSTRTLHSPAEADCSALCGAIISLGGYPIDLGTTHAGFSTRTFAAEARKAGFSTIKFKSLSQVRAGDFLLTPGRHVEFARTASRFYSAVVDERGQATGGAVGDQTSRETRFTAAYIPTYGWDYIVRPPAAETVANTVGSTGGTTQTTTGTLPDLLEDDMSAEAEAQIAKIDERTSTLLARSEKAYGLLEALPAAVWRTIPTGSDRSPLSTLEWTHRMVTALRITDPTTVELGDVDEIVDLLQAMPDAVVAALKAAL